MYKAGSAGDPVYKAGSTGDPVYKAGAAGDPVYKVGSVGDPVYKAGAVGDPVYKAGSAGVPGVQGRGCRGPYTYISLYSIYLPQPCGARYLQYVFIVSKTLFVIEDTPHSSQGYIRGYYSFAAAFPSFITSLP